MASIPSPIRKWIRRYITGEGSNEIANQSPVQSVNSQTGDVTISTGGGSIPPSQTVTSYSDLPTTDLSEAEIWLVAGEEDVVVSTQLSPVVWRSVSDFTKVASQIPDETVDNYETVDADPPGVYESGQTLADYYTGSTGAFARTSTDAIEGGQSVETTTETANVFIISDPGEGLNKYPSHNDTMSFLIQDNGIAGQVYCGSGANDTGYSAVVNSGSDQIEIRRLDGQGNFIPPLGTTTVTLDGTTWYWGEVDIPSDGGSSHEFRLYGLNTSDLTRGSLLATVTASDSNFTTDLGVGVARHSSAGTGLINDRSRIE